MYNSCDPSCEVTVSHGQVTGRHHREKGQSCEDVMLLKRSQNCLFCGIADGQSGAEHGAKGGRACLQAVADYVLETGIENIIHAPFPDELPCMVVQAFRKRLAALANATCSDLKAFASTLLTVSVDLETGEYVIFHLGDGYAIGTSHHGDAAVISSAENVSTPYMTWLTTSQNAVSHLRVTFGSMQDQKRILLLSDGAVCFCRSRNIPWRVKELLNTGSQAELHSHLAMSDPWDDATYVMLDCVQITDP